MCCRCRLGEDKRGRQKTAAGKKAALDEKTKHRTFFKGMKSMYNQIVALAMSMPLMVLSMMFDGMDQVQQASLLAAMRCCAVENLPATLVCKNQRDTFMEIQAEGHRLDNAWFCPHLHTHIWMDFR